MPRKKRKALIIAIVGILIIVVSILTALLYFMTDIFKSNQSLFLQYISQNINNVDEVYKILTEDEYEEKLKENKYTNDTQIKINYTENIGTSSENTKNSINQLKLKIEGQVDCENKYNYQNMKLLNNNDEIMQIEYLEDDSINAIRFSNLFKQYIATENLNLKELLKNMGYENPIIESIPDKIEYENSKSIFEISDEEKEIIKNKYFNIIAKDISKNNFSKTNNELIRINGKDINTNSYTLKITKEQLNNLYIKLLEELNQDEIILKKLDEMQEILDKYKVANSWNDINIRNEFNKQINMYIQKIQGKNIGQDEVSIYVYENNNTTVRTSIISKEYEINFDYLPQENDRYMRY